MSKLIDANDLLNALKEERKNGNFVFTSKWIKEIIGKLPTADVVEVVRCKDCKYWDTRDSKGTQGICLCGAKDCYYGSEFYPFADDYCSYGERRENGT